MVNEINRRAQLFIPEKGNTLISSARSRDKSFSLPLDKRDLGKQKRPEIVKEELNLKNGDNVRNSLVTNGIKVQHLQKRQHTPEKFFHIGSLVQSRSDLNSSADLSCDRASPRRLDENEANHPSNSMSDSQAYRTYGSSSRSTPTREAMDDRRGELRKMKSKDSVKTNRKSRSKRNRDTKTNKISKQNGKRADLALPYGKAAEGRVSSRTSCDSTEMINRGESKSTFTNYITNAAENRLPLCEQTHSIHSSARGPPFEEPLFINEPYGSVKGQLIESKYEDAVLQELAETYASQMDISAHIYGFDSTDLTLHYDGSYMNTFTLELHLESSRSDEDSELTSYGWEMSNHRSTREDSREQDENPTKQQTTGPQNKKEKEIENHLCCSNHEYEHEGYDEYTDKRRNKSKTHMERDKSITWSSKNDYVKGDDKKIGTKNESYHNRNAHSGDLDRRKSENDRKEIPREFSNQEGDMGNQITPPSTCVLHPKENLEIYHDHGMKYLSTTYLYSEDVNDEFHDPLSASLHVKNLHSHCPCPCEDYKTEECDCPNMEVHNGLGMTMMVPLCSRYPEGGVDERRSNIYIKGENKEFLIARNMSDMNERTEAIYHRENLPNLRKSVSMMENSKAKLNKIDDIFRDYGTSPLVYYDNFREERAHLPQKDEKINSDDVEKPTEHGTVDVENKEKQTLITTHTTKANTPKGTGKPYQNYNRSRVMFYGIHPPTYHYWGTSGGHPQFQHNSQCQISAQELGFQTEDCVNKSLNAQSEIIIRPPACFGGPLFFKGNVAKSIICKKDYISDTVFAINWEKNKLRRKRHEQLFGCCC
ncbi:hypothetical protein BgAZ_203790 [Babesia gibsoni]|uniref:Uncharacterized protein n=1 Tax=Babesia gibsoni TaxID=33632 RepID=A0AAD8LL27_BABGI|nr:hypothetical protein BgAZ_203790 [Babesia gibsoni]